jgi:hypothetical protein
LRIYLAQGKISFVMPNEILKVETDPELNLTQVIIRLPEFINFGEKLDELQEEAADAWLADPGAIEGMGETTEKLTELTNNTLAQLEEKLATMPDGPMKDQMRMGMEMFKQMQSTFLNEDENEEDDEEEDSAADEDDEPAADESDEEEEEIGDDEEYESDPNVLRVLLPPGVDWDDQQEARLHKFLQQWPKLRPKLLKQVFEVYEEARPEAVEMYGGTAGLDLVLPAPLSPEAITQLFRITTIELYETGRIGLSGRCTWEEEHGFGALIEGDKILRVGTFEESNDD